VFIEILWIRNDHFKCILNLIKSEIPIEFLIELNNSTMSFFILFI
jgi:hypothetical protein